MPSFDFFKVFRLAGLRGKRTCRETGEGVKDTPGVVTMGNSLSLECWAAWSNIHYMAPWLPLALKIQTPEAMEQGQSPKPAEVERIKVALGQQELAF